MDVSEGAFPASVPASHWQVPAYEQLTFRPKTASYCLCVFVINENGRLHRQLEAMRPYAADLDVVIADGGSSDGSTARAQLEPRGVNTLLTKTGPGRLGAQMRMAFAWALGRSYQGVIVMDGNGKDGAEALPRFVGALAGGWDHVQGSRFIPGGVSENLPFMRWAGIRFVHAPVLSLAAGFHYTDTTNGFRGYSARLLADPRVAVFRDVFAGYELHYYLSIRAARLGYRTTEIPVARRYPRAGPVPTKITPVRGSLRVLQCMLAASFGRYDP